MKPSSLVALVALAGVLTACGAKTVDAGVLSTKVKAVVEQRDETGAEVTCPSGVKAKKGVHFTCTVFEAQPSAEHTAVPATMTDDKGHFTMVVRGNTFTDHYAG
ncbi:MAG: hypothetical protein QOF76_5588 [Solirubrobacteraceae bacterium]|jgi:hypothetical protein|nr:hypothetical protein [Solirubrobacteraceae bacterium]